MKVIKSILAMVTALAILCGGGCNLHRLTGAAIAETKMEEVEAMAQNETWLNHDLLEAVQVQYLDGNLFSQDNAGNLIGVLLTRDGVPYAGGGSVSANVIRADGTTVAVVGALSGNAATVVLPQAAYAVPGVVSIVVKLTVSGEVTTIAAVVANVYQSSTDSAIDPGTIIPSVQTLIAAIDAAVASIPADYSSLWTSLAPAFSTSVNYTAGQYVTYNGAVYRFTVDHPAGAWNSAHVVATNLGSDLSSLKSALDNDILAIDTNVQTVIPLWEQGSISGTGEETTSSTRIRSKFILVKNYETITITPASGYMVAVNAYGRDYAFDSEAYSWKTSAFSITSPSYYFIRLVVAYTNSSSILPSAGNTGVSISVKSRFSVLADEVQGIENDISSYRGTEIKQMRDAILQKSFTLTKGDTSGYYDGTEVVSSSVYTCIHITEKTAKLSFEILQATASQAYVYYEDGTLTECKIAGTYDIDTKKATDIWINFFGSTYCAGFNIVSITPVDKIEANNMINDKIRTDYVFLTQGEKRGYYNGSTIVDSSVFKCIHIMNPVGYSKLEFTILQASASSVYVYYKDGTVGEYRMAGIYCVDLTDATDIWLNFYGVAYCRGYAFTTVEREIKQDADLAVNDKITITEGNLFGYYNGSTIADSSAFKSLHITDVSKYDYLEFTILQAAASMVYVVRKNGNVTEIRVEGTYAINLSDVSSLWLNFYGSAYCEGFTFTKRGTKKIITVGSTGCDYTNIVRACKENNHNAIFKLAGETFNVEAQYKEVYGNDYFVNYTNMYTSDPMDRGIYLGLGCEMIGTPKTVLDFSSYTGAKDEVIHQFSIVATSSDNVVKSIHFKSNGNCRYHIHDDIYVALGTTNTFENLIFEGTTVALSNPYYGAGMGIENTQILKNCYFMQSGQRAIGNHNNSSAGKNLFIIEDCYCNGPVFLFHYGASTEKSLCLVHGNAFTSLEIRYVDQETYPNENLEVVAWNNTIIQ